MHGALFCRAAAQMIGSQMRPLKRRPYRIRVASCANHLTKSNVGPLSWRSQRGGSGDHDGSIPNFRSGPARSYSEPINSRMFDLVPAAWLYHGAQRSQPLQRPRLIYRQLSNRKKKRCRSLGKQLKGWIGRVKTAPIHTVCLQRAKLADLSFAGRH